MMFLVRQGAFALAAATLVGCSDGTGPGAVNLTAISPAPQASSVSPGTPIVLTFSAGMMPGMAQYMDLHQGGVSGPVVPMNCSWSSGETMLTCQPQAPLASGTQYTIHVGAGMTGGQGQRMPMDAWTGMGGQWATSGMMGGTHAGQPVGMMGTGWMDGAGHFGMTFEFTTS